MNVAYLRVCLENEDGFQIQCKRSAAENGAFSFSGLISGNYYVRVERPDYQIQEYYNGSPDRSGASPISLDAPEKISGIDFNLPEIGHIYGMVQQEGTPEIVEQPYPDVPAPGLSGSTVCIQPVDMSSDPQCKVTDRWGTFRFQYINIGEYYLWAEPLEHHAGQYFPGVFFREEAVPINLLPNVEARINLILPELVSTGTSGSISGIVSGDITGILACARYEIYCAKIESDGSYQIKYLPPGLYTVSTNQNDGAVDLGFYPSGLVLEGATPVEVIAGQDTGGIDIQLTDLFVVQTEPGYDQTFQPYENLTLTFEYADSGFLKVLPVEDPVNLPADIQVLGTAFDVQAECGMTNAQVCIKYSDEGLTEEEELELKLMHYEQGIQTWVDETDPGFPDIVNNLVCGTVDHFSPFAIVRPHQVADMSIRSFSSVTAPVQIGATITAQAELADWSPSESYHASLNWGDGNSSEQEFIDGMLSVNHQIQTPGVYELNLSVTGSDGSSE